MRMFYVLLILPFLVACAEKLKPLPAASSISLSTLEGDWEGVWRWKPSESSTLIFDGNQVRLKNFPVEIAGELKILDSDAIAEAPQGYGSSNTLAVLALLKEHNSSVAFFAYGMSGDLVELRYSVRERLDERIIFRRLKK